MDRGLHKQQFIEEYLQTWYNIEPMTGDASFRSYTRIKTPITTYVLMDSPPEYYSVEPFEQIASWLIANNLSAPQIFHSDRERGFLLLEDFGDTLLQHVLEEDRKHHYQRTIDLLVALHKIQPPLWLPYYSNEMHMQELEIFTDYYCTYYNGGALLDEVEKQNYLAIWSRVLNNIPNLGDTIVLRDYHVQNLMHIEEREGLQSLGILDFQDAMIGSPIYDIVSILEDAREDVDFEFAREIFEYYLNQMPIDKDRARVAYDILGAQRNIRILGVFARKKIRDGSDNYLALIPRVLKYLERDLENPLLSEVKKWHQERFV